MSDVELRISGATFKLLREVAIVMGKSDYNMVIVELALDYLRRNTPDGHAPEISPSPK